MNAAAHLSRISEKRRKWVLANQENEFDFRTLLTELYPDEAHFIYELLQNAEDARATSVSFDLRADGLILTHDGRVFSPADVESITQIGKSTKKDDVNQIGKFGVGFKAVFAYTDTPRVFSGDYAFEVRDLVCPEPLPAAPGLGTATRFEFPFNRTDKTPLRAHAETASGLRALAAETLLFLTHVREITWCVEEESAYGRVERVGEEQGRVTIIREAPGDAFPAVTHWLRFQSPLKDKPKLNVAVAFAIEPHSAKPAPGGDAEGDPAPALRIAETDGKLFLFFPADKESPRLRFHIHGPYASTVARDSIRHADAGNQQLLAQTAELLVGTLPAIRDMGLLTTDFLAVLPNREDDLEPFYGPIRDAVLGILRRENLVPAHAGGHLPARDLVQGPRAIKDVITDDLLPFFLSTGTARTARWAPAGAVDQRRENLLLSSLGIEAWTWPNLGSALHHHFTGWIAPAARDWLAARPDEWMYRFYALLEVSLAHKVSIYDLQEYQIVRLASGEHVRARDAYFPGDGDPDFASRLPYLKSEVLAGRNRERSEKVKSFLGRLGVKTAGVEEELVSILDSYYRQDSPNPSTEDHILHLRRFIEWWKEEDSSIFEDAFLFLAADGETFCQPDGMYLDSPYSSTGLASVLASDDGHEPLWSGYIPAKLDGLEEFAAELGVMRHLQIEKTTIPETHPDYAYLRQEFWRTRTEYALNDDYTISGLVGYFNRLSVEVSRCVWNTLLAASRYQQEARQRPNNRAALLSRPSTLVYELRSRAWVPDAEGNFYMPSEITLADVHPTFRRDDPNGWLPVVGLGERVQQRQEAYQARKQAAESIGIPLELADRLAALPADDRTAFLHEFMELVDRRARSPFPERESADPVRRGGRVAAEAAQAPAVEFERRNRSVRVSDREARADAREYLRDLYTNDDGIMVCQICEREMPFKLASGEYYFETVQLLALTREHRPNHLALCPVCAAKFKHANGTPDEDVIGALTGAADGRIRVVLARAPESLRFVSTHLGDIRAVLSTEPQVGAESCS